ncbi:RlpA-like double-psi beta-barrel domain-containing protein [Streptomyces sp. B1-3]|uniref:RlpA-like double-psi beta-barrel domain-containing protein n=1 Tax=Streptomyces sp. B1-3 TaxID=3141453 RepID=UPI003D27FB3C
MRRRRAMTITVATLLATTAAIGTAHADVGTATFYNAPYLPTKCWGNDTSNFPPGNMFVAVSDGLWDNGAACGRQYQVACFSAPNRACKSPTIVVRVVDHRNVSGRSMALSNTAYDQIADRKKSGWVTIEYAELDNATG